MLHVLGCLDGTGPLQQVKVRRLISGNLDAHLMINDPAYYLPDKSLEVFLENARGEKVRLDPVLYPPQSGGDFAQDSNRIYETTVFQTTPGLRVWLEIDDPANGKTITSAINTVGQAAFGYPAKGSLKGKFRFTDSQRPFHIEYSQAPASIWTVSVKYVDYLLNGGSVCRKVTYNGPAWYGPHSDLHISQSFPLEYLWKIFNLSVPDDPDIDYRKFYRFDFTVWNGDSTLSNYMDVADRFTDNRKQYFCNIEGGMGLFFSVSHDRIRDIWPNDPFCAVLANADTLKHLKFSPYPYEGPYTDPDSVPVNPFLNILK
jgi:hypothetical protein